MDKDYRYYRDAVRGRLLPLAYVDLDRFDKNVQDILARSKGFNLCVASKSVRCVSMLRRIMEASPQCQAIMAYSAREAALLCDEGFDNILVAYPVWSEVRASGVCDRLSAGKTIALMIDCVDHIDLLEAAGAEADTTIPVCIDIDMSDAYPGLHFGVRRSSITTPEQALELWDAVKRSPHVDLTGVMGYEAQVAGLQDSVPGSGIKGTLIRYLKGRSIRNVPKRRGAIVRALREAGCELRFVNGGGTGSIETTIQEDGVVTEATAGSGFYCPALFDHYANFHHLPAAGYAIEITRQPLPNVYTCHGGGYIASGAAGPDRLPKPFLPAGAALLDLEGAGEVQTPIAYDGPESLGLGDPVFLRHAKAGELCERFNTLNLIKDGQIVDEVPTYRGQGWCFL